MRRRGGAAAGGGGFTADLFDEDCEGTGLPSGWTGTANWDYTTTVIEGTKSLLCNGTDTSYAISETTVETYCLLRFLAIPGGTSSIFSVRGSSIGAIFRINSSGAVSCYANGSDSTATVSTMTTGVNYHCWLRFVSGGTCSAAFSTDGTRPTSGNNYASKTGLSTTATIIRHETIQHIADRIIGHTGTIPSNP